MNIDTGPVLGRSAASSCGQTASRAGGRGAVFAGLCSLVRAGGTNVVAPVSRCRTPPRTGQLKGRRGRCSQGKIPRRRLLATLPVNWVTWDANGTAATGSATSCVHVVPWPPDSAAPGRRRSNAVTGECVVPCPHSTTADHYVIFRYFVKDVNRGTGAARW